MQYCWLSRIATFYSYRVKFRKKFEFRALAKCACKNKISTCHPITPIPYPLSLSANRSSVLWKRPEVIFLVPKEFPSIMYSINLFDRFTYREAEYSIHAFFNLTMLHIWKVCKKFSGWFFAKFSAYFRHGTRK